jgi:hypothetical protein
VTEAELIRFPDIEDLVRRHLGPLLGVPVYAGITPRELPALSVTVTRTGGAQRSIVLDDARVSLDARAASTPSAALDLARQLGPLLMKAGLEGFLAGNPLYDVTEDTGPYINPDPVNPSQHRYTCAYVLTVRALPSGVNCA